MIAEEGPVVRPADGADREPLWPLVREFAASFTPKRANFEAAFDAMLTTADTLVLVADSPQLGIVGYLLAYSHGTFFADAPVVWVEEVMVDDRVRGTGIGRALMTRAERWSRAIGAAYVALATRRAPDFYLALGYEDSAVFYRKTLT